MTRFIATALAATLALGGLAGPALAHGHGHGHGDKHASRESRGDRGYTYDNRNRGNEQGDNDDGDRANGENGNNGPHSCVNPAGNTRGWCKHNGNNGYGNGYPGNGNGGYNTQQISGVVTAVSGSRITILSGLRTINIDATQAYNNNRVSNVGLGATVTATGYFANNGTFYATQVN